MIHAYFLVAHGSRSPHPQAALQALADLVQAAAQDESISKIGTGFLEFQPIPLAEQLLQFQASLPASCTKIFVIPVFLLPGNHVKLDIPDEILAAQNQLAQQHQSTQLLLTPHVGNHPAIQRILRRKMDTTSPKKAWILLGHGSRRSAGNQAIAQLAESIDAIPAFWAVEPGLTAQIENLIAQGQHSIGILPYFLFTGKITATIAQQVETLAKEHPAHSLSLLSPLEPSPELATAILELAHLSAVDLAPPSMAKLV